jgi:all-trans-retinol dehydrogenase (NAD+)
VEDRVTQIAGRTMLITGGASGIGRQLARHACRAGASLVLWDVNGEGLDTVAAELTPRGHGVRVMRVDVSDRAAVYEGAATVRAAGGIDVLVNNAGIVSGRLLIEIPDEDILATFAVNTLGLYWVTKAFLPDMIERDRGHIVTMASAAGLVGVVRQTDYAASKHAAIGFDESLRYELRRIAPHVVTTVVCPFYVRTGMFEGVQSRFPRLLPLLEEGDVAARVLNAIERNERRVLMPAIVRVLPALRLLPVAVFDRLIDAFGVNASMNDFLGHGHRGAQNRG